MSSRVSCRSTSGDVDNGISKGLGRFLWQILTDATPTPDGPLQLGQGFRDLVLGDVSLFRSL